MAEQMSIDASLPKKEKYESLLPQISGLIAPEENLVANLANISAALKESFSFLWVGFYLVENRELVLGPFQGPVACTRFPATKGVCGACVMKKQSIIVPDVNAFPGHISCSALSKSEIVVPVFNNGEVVMVLDADSKNLAEFDETDRQGLEAIAALIADRHYSK